MPIQFNQPGVHSSIDGGDLVDNKYGRISNSAVHYGLWLRLTSGFDTIIPISLHLVGGRARPLVNPGSAYDHSPEEAFPWSLTSEPNLRQLFNGFPILQVADCVLLAPFVTSASAKGQVYYQQAIAEETFEPRMFADAWYLHPRLESDTQVTSPLYGINYGKTRLSDHMKGLHRFNILSDLIDEIVRLDCQVEWRGHTPQDPFQLIHAEDIVLKLPTNPPSIAENVEHLINQTLTCQLAYECIQPSVEDTILCEQHIDKILDLSTQGLLQTSSLDVSTEAIEWALPTNPQAAKICKAALKLLHNSDPKHIWVGDCEGLPGIRRGYASIPIEFGLVSYANRQVTHSDFIKYPQFGDAYAMAREVEQKKAVVFKSGIFDMDRIQNSFRSSYGGANVTGLTLSEHKQRLEGIGFDESKAVFVNWGTTHLDKQALGRIMREEEELIVDPQRVALVDSCKTINLCKIYELCTMSEPEGRPLKLKAVWKRCFPTAGDVSLSWHTALWDALAARQILCTLLEGIPLADL